MYGAHRPPQRVRIVGAVPSLKICEPCSTLVKVRQIQDMPR
jgi:hypothetical protein